MCLRLLCYIFVSFSSFDNRDSLALCGVFFAIVFLRFTTIFHGRTYGLWARCEKSLLNLSRCRVQFLIQTQENRLKIVFKLMNYHTLFIVYWLSLSQFYNRWMQGRKLMPLQCIILFAYLLLEIFRSEWQAYYYREVTEECLKALNKECMAHRTLTQDLVWCSYLVSFTMTFPRS